MATDPYDEILRQFEGMSREERQQLLKILGRQYASDASSSNGRTLADSFRDFGMIGSITDAPADWSTNPKYMEGFGNDSQ